MKAAVLGALAGASLLALMLGVFEAPSEVFAQRPAPPQRPGGAGELIVLPTPIGDKGQLLTVIDPAQRVMGVYHIDLATGKIALRSVRNIHWDFQMTHLNNESPLPQEIRTLLEQR